MIRTKIVQILRSDQPAVRLVILRGEKLAQDIEFRLVE